MNNIITFILTHEDEDTFITHIKGIINQADSPNFFLFFRSKLLLALLQNYKDGSKFRLLIHLGSQRSSTIGVSGGVIANELKNNDIFKGLKFDFTTRNPDAFKNPNEIYTIDSNGNVIHNASEMDSTIVDRMILYEMKNGKATGEVKVDKLSSQNNSVAEKIAILTALDLELKEIKKYLNPSEKTILRDQDKQFFYEVYTYKNRNNKLFDIHVKVTGKQNFASSSATTDLIHHVSPEFLFYVGIAGKLKDVDIGDVVVADVVENYEPSKVEDSDHKTRIYQGHADSYLISLASSIITDTEEIWQRNIKVKKNENIKHEPADYKGRIATGEKVLETITAEVYKTIRHDCSESLAIECEGGGFYHSCNQKHAKGLLIRGISDKLKDKGFVEEYNSQPYAASCAAAFLFELIDRL